MAALAWSLGLFTLLRSPAAQAWLVLPLTELQKQVADYHAGPPTAPIVVTAECSGTDLLALCLAAILACPVSWRTRLAGAAGGVALILALNSIRIATLGRAAASPALFRALHLQVWPAILILAVAVYVFAWMRQALRPTRSDEPRSDEGAALPALLRRFTPRAIVLLVAFALCGPWIPGNQALLRAGAATAGAAAFLLTAAGVEAAASGNVMATSRGAFVVAPECLATALVPLYFAAVLTARLRWPTRALALAAAPPLFTALAIARLLFLALPPTLAASPLFLVHGFHQLVLAVALVALLAWWREPAGPRRGARATGRAGVALGTAAVLMSVAGATVTSAVLHAAQTAASMVSRAAADLTMAGDTQGALALLPAYQTGLLLALGMTAFAGWRRLLSALGVLLASQVGLLLVLGQLLGPADVEAHALLLRVWAVGLPVILTLVMLRAELSPTGALARSRPAGEVSR